MAFQWGTVPARVAPGPQTSLATGRGPQCQTVAMAPQPAFGGPAAAAAAAAAAWTVAERWGARIRQARGRDGPAVRRLPSRLRRRREAR